MKAMPIRTNDSNRSKKSTSTKISTFGDTPVPNVIASGGQLGDATVPPPSSYQTFGTICSPSNIPPSPISAARSSVLRTNVPKTVDRPYNHNPCIRVSDAQYQITTKDKMRYHAITMMKVCKKLFHRAYSHNV